MAVALPRASTETDPLRGSLCSAFQQGESVLPSSDSRYCGTTANTLFVNGDLTTGFRAANDTLAANILKDVPVGKVDIGLYQATGLASAIYIIFGPLWAMNGLDQAHRAKEIGDTEGIIEGSLNTVLGGAFTLGGGALGTFRALSIADQFVKNPTLAMAGATTATFVGGISAYTVAFFAFIGLFGKDAYRGYQFEKELERAADKVTFLKKKFNGSGEETTLAKDKLQLIGFNLSKAIFKHRMKELGIDEVTDDKLKKMVNIYLKERCSDESSVENELEKLGKAVLNARAQEKREAALKRVMSSEALQAIKEIDQADDADAQVKFVEASVNNKKRLNFAIFAVSVITLVPLGLYLAIGVGCTLAVVGTAAAISMLVSAAGMFVIDYFYGYKAHCDKDRPGVWDRPLIYFSQGLAAVSLLGMVVISIVTGVAIGPIGYVAIGVTLLWMYQNERTRRAINACEREYRIKNPTLEFIAEAIENGDDRLMVYRMYDNLKEADKHFAKSYSKVQTNEIRVEIGRRKAVAKSEFEKYFREKLATDISTKTSAPNKPELQIQTDAG